MSDLPPVPHFTRKFFQGVPQWQCNYCPWDTLESEDVMIEHQFRRHREKIAPLPIPDQPAAAKAKGKKKKRR